MNCFAVGRFFQLLIFATCVGCGGALTNSDQDSPESKQLNAKVESRLKADPDLLPVEAFSELQHASKVKISPDGKFVSFYESGGTEIGLTTFNIETKKTHAGRIGDHPREQRNLSIRTVPLTTFSLEQSCSDYLWSKRARIRSLIYIYA